METFKFLTIQKIIVLMTLLLVVLSPGFVLATSPSIGDFEIVMCVNEQQCKPVSTDFDFDGEIQTLIAWVENFDRDRDYIDALTFFKPKLRQVGVFQYSYVYENRYQMSDVDFDSPKFFIVDTLNRPGIERYEISRQNLELINNHLNWHAEYVFQNRELNKSIKVIYLTFALGIIILVVVYYVRKSKNINTTHNSKYSKIFL